MGLKLNQLLTCRLVLVADHALVTAVNFVLWVPAPARAAAIAVTLRYYTEALHEDHNAAQHKSKGNDLRD